MPEITHMDKRAIGQIDELTLESLDHAAREFGLLLTRGRGRFDPRAGTYTQTLVWTCQTEDGVPTSFVERAPLYGLTGAHYGAEFTCRGQTYRLVDFATRNPKLPVIAMHTEERANYKFPVSVLSHLAHLGGR